MSFLKKYWPHIIALLTVAEPFLEPSLKVYISQHPHASLAVLLGAVIAMYHARAPKDQAGPNQQQQGSGNGATQACVVILALLCVSSVPSHGQAKPAEAASLTNIYAGGISFNSSGSPEIAGTGLYARQIGSSGTYAFTVVDALPASVHPFTVTTNFSGGIAQKLFSVGGVGIYVPSSAGVSYTGSNTGWAWSTGGLASVKLKGSWYAFPNVRVLKSSVGGSGYQPIVGILFGWGN